MHRFYTGDCSVHDAESDNVAICSSSGNDVEMLSDMAFIWSKIDDDEIFF